MGSPADAAIPRRSPSIRRTSNIDMHRAEGHLHLRGAARDLVTLDGRAVPVAEAELGVEVDPEGRLAALTATPAHAETADLLGRQVGAGFRDAVRAALPDEVAASTPLALLLDDLPVAALISGYALLYSGDLSVGAGARGLKEDVCSGWRAGGTMMVSVRAGHGVPVTVGPPAPEIAGERARDPLGWHELGALPLGAMRRRRLVDVHPGTADRLLNVTAMFRDTHVDAHGAETVLHEYALTATVDPSSGLLTSCAAVPRVLPWVECPVAAASADRLAGRPISAVRDVVRAELRGTSTCTHLNDLLRSLGDVATLADALRLATA